MSVNNTWGVWHHDHRPVPVLPEWGLGATILPIWESLHRFGHRVWRWMWCHI